ncbi:LemA family protein [Patescibacteria group bacterium]|nr:LemA family protein [Patescibacteria group bacterium]
MISRSKIVFLVLIGAIAIVLFWIWGGYNGFVTARENVDVKWAQVEADYQRRADLIPNLVNTVKGAAAFEKDTFIGVTEARTKWMNASGRDGQMEAAQGMDSALSRLLLTFENYPDLKATKAYTDLMAQLEGTENRITVSRKDFNEAVRTFNVKVKRFPGNVLAGVFGFDAEEFFQSDEGSEDAPVVNFE